MDFSSLVAGIDLGSVVAAIFAVAALVLVVVVVKWGASRVLSMLGSRSVCVPSTHVDLCDPRDRFDRFDDGWSDSEYGNYYHQTFDANGIRRG
jgi:hypothetical protein